MCQRDNNTTKDQKKFLITISTTTEKIFTNAILSKSSFRRVPPYFPQSNVYILGHTEQQTMLCKCHPSKHINCSFVQDVLFSTSECTTDFPDAVKFYSTPIRAVIALV